MIATKNTMMTQVLRLLAAIARYTAGEPCA
jgi:hypothetical protein